MITHWGDVAQEVKAVVWQSEGCRFDPTLGVSKCPWARCLTPNCSWRAGWYLAWQLIVNVCVNGWMRGINCKVLWIKALYKCSPFTITIAKSFVGAMWYRYAVHAFPLYFFFPQTEKCTSFSSCFFRLKDWCKLTNVAQRTTWDGGYIVIHKAVMVNQSR